MYVCIRSVLQYFAAAHCNILENTTTCERGCCMYVCMYVCICLCVVLPDLSTVNVQEFLYSSKYVAVCCSVLQCAAMCCSVLQCVAVCCRVLQRAAECCRVLQSVTKVFRVLQSVHLNMCVHVRARTCVRVYSCESVHIFVCACACACARACACACALA